MKREELIKFLNDYEETPIVISPEMYVDKYLATQPQEDKEECTCIYEYNDDHHSFLVWQCPKCSKLEDTQPQEQEETILVDDNSIMGQTMKRSDYEAQFKQSQAQRIEEQEDYIDHFRYKRDNDEPAKEQNETN